ncbi:MAG: MerR family transcriptional regulator [Streptosporangiales bacterium]
MSDEGEPADSGRVWTPGAVARMVGVAPSTLRTWDRRYGLGPSAHPRGAHRRYTESDVARLRRMVALTARGLSPAAAAEQARSTSLADDVDAPSEHAAGTVDPSAARGLARAASRLDAPLMRWVATRLVRDHGVVAAWEQVFAPLLVEIGRRHGSHGSGIEVEHLVTRSILRALTEVPEPTEQGRLPVLLACAPEEQHELPLAAVAAALAEAGCPSRNLGARVPAPTLLAAVSRLRPLSVVVWAHEPRDAGRVPVAELGSRTDTSLVVAGPGWQDALPVGVRHVDSLGEAVGTLLAGGSGRLPP